MNEDKLGNALFLHSESLQRIAKVLLAAVAVMTFGTVGFKLLDHAHKGSATWYDCMYQTFIIVSTLGIDKVSGLLDNHWGRSFSMIVWLSGAFVYTYALTTMTAFVIEGELSDFLGRRRMDREIAKLTNHYIVCGCGRTGLYIVNELIATKRPFVVIDTDQDRLRETAEQKKGLLYLVGDAHEEEMLTVAGLARSQGLLATLASDRDNLFLVITARQLSSKLRIIARGYELTAKDKLVRAGANNVIYPNFIGGMRMVSEMIRPSVVTFIDQMLRDELRFEQVVVREGAPLDGKTIGESGIRQQTGLLVVACRVGAGDFDYNPSASTVIRPDMTLVLLGHTDHLPVLRQLAGEG